MKSVKSIEKAATSIELPVGGGRLRSARTIARAPSLSAASLVTAVSVTMFGPVVVWTNSWKRAGWVETGSVSTAW